MERYFGLFNGATKHTSVLLLGVSLGLSCSEVRDLKASTEWQYLNVSDVNPFLQPVAIQLPESMFWMGDNVDLDERPRHQVTLTHPIEAMRTEVTQELYELIMENNPSFFQRCGLNCPVEKVRWIQSIEFSNRLNQILGLPICYAVGERGTAEWVTGLDCTGWRLPTEAEWEWIAVSGQTEHPMLNKIAWFSENANARTHSVCTRSEDQNGLCDVFGNVQEWVWDMSADYPSRHPDRPLIDPIGPSEGTHHVFRGGAWNRYGENLTEVIRKDASYLFRNNDLGFRLVRTISID
jgi:formylglycine-generating enzyme required for sulfatase activity